MISMNEIVKAIDYLPVFNKTANRILNMIRQNDYQVKEVAEIIRMDATLSANVLKAANSALFAKRNEIHDVMTAISYLGKDQLTSLLTLVASKDYFTGPMPGYEVHQGELWEHNLCVAVLAETLDSYEPDLDKSLLFMSGLLHDIGKIVLNFWINKDWVLIKEKVEKEEMDFITAEKEILGYTHAEIGGAVLKHWKLPDPIITAARHHHDTPLYDHPLVRIIMLADYLSFLMGFMTQKDNMKMKGYQEVLEYYQIKTRDIDYFLSLGFEKINNALNMFKMN